MRGSGAKGEGKPERSVPDSKTLSERETTAERWDAFDCVWRQRNKRGRSSTVFGPLCRRCCFADYCPSRRAWSNAAAS